MRRILLGALCVVLSSATMIPQERTFPVPSNVTLDGVPPIPMSLVESVAPYGQFRQARLVAWHPVERQMIVATTLGAVPQLHQVKFPGAARTQHRHPQPPPSAALPSRNPAPPGSADQKPGPSHARHDQPQLSRLRALPMS